MNEDCLKILVMISVNRDLMDISGCLDLMEFSVLENFISQKDKELAFISQ